MASGLTANQTIPDKTLQKEAKFA